MVINKNSWHYRIAKLGKTFASDIPTNLCPYFRLVAFKSLGMLILSFLALFLFFNAGMAAIMAWTGVSKMAVTFVTVLIATGIGVLVVAVFAGIVAGIGFCVVKLYAKREQKQLEKIIEKNRQIREGTWVEPEKNIFVAWLSAKHDKICPQLEFKNDKS